MAMYHPSRAWGQLPAGGSALDRFLQQVGDDVCAVMREAESEFLFLGSRLHEFKAMADGIVRTTSQNAGLLSGGGMSSAIDGLSSLVQNMKTFQGRFRDETKLYEEKLGTILEMSGTVGEPIQELKVMARTLKSISVATKIQTAIIGRIRAEDGFNILSGNIRNLAASTENRSGHVLELINALTRSIYDALSTNVALEFRQQDRAQGILKETLAIIESLTVRHRESSDAAARIAEQYAQISERMGDVVASLQIHDIARQRLDHVRENLSSLSSIRLTGSSGGNGDGGGEFLTPEMIRACRLQADLLRDGVRRFVGAVNEIFCGLGSVSDHVNSILMEGLSMTAGKSGTGASFLAELEAGLLSVSEAFTVFSSNAEANRNMMLAVSAITTAVDEISLFVNDMQEIEEEIEFIAFNSTIKADQIGQKGAGISIISEYIQKASRKAHLLTFEIAEKLQAVKGYSDRLSDEVGQVFEEREAAIERMVADLRQVAESVRVVNREMKAGIEGTDRESRRLVDGIDETIRRITVHDMVSEVVRRAVNSLEKMADTSAYHVAMGTDGDHAGLLDAFTGSYTMEEERRIHQSHILGWDPRSPVDVSRMRAGRAPAGDATRHGEENWENVEFFDGANEVEQ